MHARVGVRCRSHATLRGRQEARRSRRYSRGHHPAQQCAAKRSEHACGPRLAGHDKAQECRPRRRRIVSRKGAAARRGPIGSGSAAGAGVCRTGQVRGFARTYHVGGSATTDSGRNTDPSGQRTGGIGRSDQCDALIRQCARRRSALRRSPVGTRQRDVADRSTGSCGPAGRRNGQASPERVGRMEFSGVRGTPQGRYESRAC